MIVKYFNNGVWGYIDNVRQVASKDIDVEELLKQYNEKVAHGPDNDMCSYMNGEKLPADIAVSNKVFTMATEQINEVFDEAQFDASHAENLLDGQRILENCPAAIIAMMFYSNEYKEYDTVTLVTNQKCFLMNDKGQTIERLI